MDREKCNKDVEITIKLKVRPEHYKTIHQEHITDHKDDLTAGIYRFLLLKEETYIICCIRGKETLDYTRFAGNQKTAEILYEKMLKEIERDLNR